MQEEILCQDPLDEMKTVLSDKAKELFAICDKELKGFITRRDLQRLTHEMPLSPDVLEEVFDKLDDDKNGYLSLEEFTDGFGCFLGLGQEEVSGNKEVEEHDYCITTETESDDSGMFDSLINQLDANNDVIVEKQSLKEIWKNLRKTDPESLNLFEEFIAKIFTDLKNSRKEQHDLEAAMKTRANIHDEEVRKLYEEMEHQLAVEKQKILHDEQEREKRLKDDLMTELSNKEKQIQDLVKMKNDLKNKYKALSSSDIELRNENDLLQKKSDELQDNFRKTLKELEDSQSYIQMMKQQSQKEKVERAKSTLKVNEGIARERLSLVKQLDQLREMNKQLKDERDELADYKASVEYLDEIIKQINPTHKYEDDEVDGERSDGKEEVISPAVNVPQTLELNGTSAPSAETVKSNDGITIQLPNGPQFQIPAQLNSNLLSVASPSTAPQRGRSGSIVGSYMTDYENNSDFEEVEEVHEKDLISAIKGSRRNLFEDSDNDFSSWTQSPSASLPVTTPISAIESGRLSTIESRSYEVLKMPERIFKVAVIGDSGVGKTSFVQRVCHDSYDEPFKATIGIDYAIKNVEFNDRLYSVQFWDTAGQERFRCITKQFFRRCDGIIFMFDVTNEQSFLNVRHWTESIEDEADEDIVLVMIGAKADVNAENRTVSCSDAEIFSDKYKYTYLEVSSKDGKGICESVETLIEKLQLREDKELDDARMIKLKQTKKKKGCC